MNPEEVMVGNYVYDTWDEKERQIYPVDVLNIENGRDIFNPIKITPEWLLKFGFEDSIGGYYIRIREIDIVFEDSYCSLWDDSGYVCDLSHIKYVHQLQNLVSSLTGNQLTIVTDK